MRRFSRDMDIMGKAEFPLSRDMDCREIDIADSRQPVQQHFGLLVFYHPTPFSARANHAEFRGKGFYDRCVLGLPSYASLER